MAAKKGKVSFAKIVLGLYYLAEAMAVKLGVVSPKLPPSAWACVIVAVAVVVLALDSLPPAAKVALVFASLVAGETVAVVTTARGPDRPNRRQTETSSSRASG